MTPRKLVFQALQKREPPTIPWQLDITDEVHDRLVLYFDDPDFVTKIGNSLAQERNELLEDIGDKRFRDMFGVVWTREQRGDFGVVLDYLLKEPAIGDYRFPEPDEHAIPDDVPTENILAFLEAVRNLSDPQCNYRNLRFIHSIARRE